MMIDYKDLFESALTNINKCVDDESRHRVITEMVQLMLLLESDPDMNSDSVKDKYNYFIGIRKDHLKL